MKFHWHFRKLNMEIQRDTLKDFVEFFWKFQLKFSRKMCENSNWRFGGISVEFFVNFCIYLENSSRSFLGIFEYFPRNFREIFFFNLKKNTEIYLFITRFMGEKNCFNSTEIQWNIQLEFPWIASTESFHVEMVNL